MLKNPSLSRICLRQKTGVKFRMTENDVCQSVKQCFFDDLIAEIQKQIVPQHIEFMKFQHFYNYTQKQKKKIDTMANIRTQKTLFKSQRWNDLQQKNQNTNSKKSILNFQKKSQTSLKFMCKQKMNENLTTTKKKYIMLQGSQKISISSKFQSKPLIFDSKNLISQRVLHKHKNSLSSKDLSAFCIKQAGTDQSIDLFKLKRQLSDDNNPFEDTLIDSRKYNQTLTELNNQRNHRKTKLLKITHQRLKTEPDKKKQFCWTASQNKQQEYFMII